MHLLRSAFLTYWLSRNYFIIPKKPLKLKKKGGSGKEKKGGKRNPNVFIGLSAVVKMENSSFPRIDKIYSMCVKENEILGHPSEALGVLLWHKPI